MAGFLVFINCVACVRGNLVFLKKNSPRSSFNREEGSNGDREMCAAFRLGGFHTYDVHMTDLRQGLEYEFDPGLVLLVVGIGFVVGIAVFVRVRDTDTGCGCFVVGYWSGTIHGSGRAEDKFRYTIFFHYFEQAECRVDVVTIIGKRLLD